MKLLVLLKQYSKLEKKKIKFTIKRGNKISKFPHLRRQNCGIFGVFTLKTTSYTPAVCVPVWWVFLSWAVIITPSSRCEETPDTHVLFTSVSPHTPALLTVMVTEAVDWNLTDPQTCSWSTCGVTSSSTSTVHQTHYWNTDINSLICTCVFDGYLLPVTVFISSREEQAADSSKLHRWTTSSSVELHR